MADVWGALAQVTPSAGVLTNAYTVPDGKHATIEVVICNRNAASNAVRLSHAIAGAADAVGQYLLYDFGIAAKGSVTTARFTVNSGDVIRVYNTNSGATFNINGIEE